jgi:hypothetical protein
MKAMQTVLIAVLTYALYLIWVLLDTSTAPFFAEKILGIQRLFGLVQLTGWNRPGISFASILIQRLRDYGTSYLLITLGGASVFWLLFYSFVDRGARFLTAWGIVLYPIFTFIAFAGSGNDQFFYFLLIPALILVGYAIITFPEAAHHLFSKGIPESIPGIRFIRSVSSNTWYLIGISILVLLMVVIIPFNSTTWISNYVWGSDNGYRQFSQFVQANLPPGERLNASGDPIKFRYFLPDQSITAAATPEEALQTDVSFFALAPKDVVMKYGRIQPELADWIQANGIQLFTTQGSSYGEIRLYQVELPDGSTHPTDTQDQSNTKGNYFQSAKSGFIDSLAILLLSWSFIWLGLAFYMYQSSKWATSQRVRNNDQQTDWV